METLIIYALDALIAIITAKLKNDKDPVYQDLIARLRAMVAEKRDPTSEDKAALAAFLKSERDKLHS